MFSQVNKMSAHNLAVVLVPTLFQTMNPDLLRLTREFIIHHTLLFLVNITPQEHTVTPVTSDVLQKTGQSDQLISGRLACILHLFLPLNSIS